MVPLLAVFEPQEFKGHACSWYFGGDKTTSIQGHWKNPYMILTAQLIFNYTVLIEFNGTSAYIPFPPNQTTTVINQTTDQKRRRII